MCRGAPEECTADLATQIVSNHLATASMLAIIPIQDWFAMDDSIKRKGYEAERINVPSDSNHYWRYRMHITLEKLIEADCLNNKITELIRNSGEKINSQSVLQSRRSTLFFSENK